MSYDYTLKLLLLGDPSMGKGDFVNHYAFKILTKILIDRYGLAY